MGSSAGRSARHHYWLAGVRRLAMRVAAAAAALACAAGAIYVDGIYGFTGVHRVVEEVLAGCSVALAVVAWWGPFGRWEVLRWQRGAMGEQSTGTVLDAMASRRWKVWHDLAVPGSRANIDHLVVGPTGVWLVDTKTTAGSINTRWGKVRIAGRHLDVSSTAWEAEVVAGVLSRDLGWPGGLAVTPLVVLHGLGRRRRTARSEGIAVVAPETLGRTLRAGRRTLTRTDITAIASSVEVCFGPASKRLRRSDGLRRSDARA